MIVFIDNTLNITQKPFYSSNYHEGRDLLKLKVLGIVSV